MRASHKQSGIICCVFLVFGLFLNTYDALSQDFTAGDEITLQIQDYSLIDSNHAPIAMNLIAAVAGEPIPTVTNTDMFLKISSIVPGNTNREITARIAAGVIPAGTQLTLQAAASTINNSGGRLGNPALTPIVLSDIDQPLVIDIGSCYTGTGYTDGFQLTFSWGPDGPEVNYHLIEATTEPVSITVIFTITAHDGN